MKRLSKSICISLFFPVFTGGAQETTKPNIVIIYADDMGYGDLGCQNPESKIPTPYLDNLAREGMRFTDAHSSSGICSPSRFALLTGIYHWRRGHNIISSFESGTYYFREDDYTMPQMLKDNGYNTACIGKWHLGWDWDSIRTSTDPPLAAESFDWEKPIPGGPLDRGFDYYFGDGTINFPPYCWIENDRVVEPPTVDLDLYGRETMEGNWEFRPGPMVENWNPYEVLPTLTEKAIEWIHEQHKDKPFFLLFSLPAPHTPIIPNAEFQGKTKAGGYGDFVYQVDWVTGQVLEALDKKGFRENTIVVFTSDNGPEHYAFERALKYGHFSSGKLRGVKRDVWEGGHRVPFIIRWPEKVKAGVVSNEVISQVDLMATFASIINHSLPENSAHDSYDLTPLLKGKVYDHPLREATIHNTFEDKFAIRKGKWLYINSNTGEHTRIRFNYDELRHYTDFNTSGLLFDMSVDKEQRNNLFDEHPDVVKELQNLLNKYRNSNRTVNYN